MKTIATILLVLVCSISFGQDNVDLNDLPVLGIKAIPASEIYDELKNDPFTKLPTKRGMVILEIDAKGAAATELKPGDVIIEIAGEKVASTEQFESVVKSLTVGEAVKVVGFRQIERKNKHPRWKKGSTELTPISKREFIFSRVSKTVDEVEGFEKWSHVRSSGLFSTGLNLEINKKDEQIVLTLRTSYSSDDWIFVDQIIFASEGKKETVEIADRKTEVSGGRIVEWETLIVDQKLLPLVDAINEGKPVTVRFVGDQYKVDHKVTEAEANRIQDIYAVLEILKSDLSNSDNN